MMELQEHREHPREQMEQEDEIASDAEIIRWQRNRQVRRKL